MEIISSGEFTQRFIKFRDLIDDINFNLVNCIYGLIVITDKITIAQYHFHQINFKAIALF